MRLSEAKLHELLGLLDMKDAAAGAYNEAAKAVAKELEIKPGVLKRFVKAKANGDTEELRREADEIDALIAHEPMNG